MPVTTHPGSLLPQFGKMSDGRPICPVCKADFCDITRARRHFQSKHLGIVVRCEISGCDQRRKDALRDHLVKKHSLSADTARTISNNANNFEQLKFSEVQAMGTTHKKRLIKNFLSALSILLFISKRSFLVSIFMLII